MIVGTEIDWRNPTQLQRRKRGDLRDRERLAEAKARRRKRKPGKAHSTNRERSLERKAKAAKVKNNAEASKKAYFRFHSEACAYWRGERPDYPQFP